MVPQIMFNWCVSTDTIASAERNAEIFVLGYIRGAVGRVPSVTTCLLTMHRSMDCIYLGQKYGSPLGYDRWCQVRDLLVLFPVLCGS